MSTFDPLPPWEVHLHVAEDVGTAADQDLDRYRAIMAPDEHRRCARFRFERHQRQFTITRALLRTTLSRYHPDVAPRDWRFEANDHGRPAIANVVAPGLDFNLSHTDGLIVLAVSRMPFVRVDVEWTGRPVDVDELAQRVLVAEEVASLPAEPAERHRRFFQIWALKEACIKATGQGLSIPLSNIRIGFPADRELSLRLSDDRSDTSRWRLWMLDIGDDFALAVAAMTAERCRLRLFRSTPLVSVEEVEARIARRL